jgi:hypothetical protein
MIGESFNWLKVISQVENKGAHKAYLCECKCGELTVVLGVALRSGNTKSCGCLSHIRKPIEYVITEKGCFECISHAKNNSGHITLGYRSFYGDSRFAHRLIYEECFGEIPKGQVVRHKCDNPACLNPEHLELGTQTDNVADMYKRNRSYNKSGEGNPRVLLTVEQVKEIRKKQ